MHRQIAALLDAGHEVTYIAPFTFHNVTPTARVTAVDVPRGREISRGLSRVRAALRRACRDADLLLVHDLDLLRVLPYRRPPVVWDMRETPAGPLARATAARAARRHLVLGSEYGTAAHAVVPETTLVPPTPPSPPGDTRVVHIGRLSAERGVAELVALAERLAPHGVRLDLIGGADREARPLLRDAQRAGLLDWYGYVPNRHALRMAEGALAGLSLTTLPGVPTKILDYMGRGVPVVTTPPGAEPVRRAGCGIVVPLDVEAVLNAVLDLKEQPATRMAMGERGHREARLRHHWPDHAPAFVARLERHATVTTLSLAVQPQG
ncbi:glycosyltransferase [Thermoactinospora rubra]|uniref:glycosyltransferase n=1 Tax=Thermoactinospora rubra TaxID=1088767 RepID=UPI001F0B09BD|nr:glycosyltransferase [Thermoactinospora rubra]